MSRALALALALALGACSGPDPGSQLLAPAPDLDAYTRDVHPILEARCGTLDCHGNADRPLRLYAETGLRASDPLRDTPITFAERAANVDAIAGVDDPATVDGHIVLLKALGKMKHSGGAVWTRADEPQARCVRGWLAGESASAEVAAACATAATEVALPPP